MRKITHGIMREIPNLYIYWRIIMTKLEREAQKNAALEVRKLSREGKLPEDEHERRIMLLDILNKHRRILIDNGEI